MIDGRPGAGTRDLTWDPLMTMKHFISLETVSRPELDAIIDAARRLRAERRAGRANAPLLAGRTLAMIFEKPSLRTRVSFEQAIVELGGHAIVLTDDEVGLGSRESPADVARVLAGMVDGIVARVFEHEKLVEMARHVDVPVINALSDRFHPVQALADALTLMDALGPDLSSRTLAFIGDGNNVARSLALLCAKLGMRFVIASPAGFELEAQFLDALRRRCGAARIETIADPVIAVRGADAVYTDTWVSMGQEAETARRRASFEPYQVNDRLLAEAAPHAIVLHCLPAHRGEEVTDAVLDGPRSRVFPQAHNRLHAQKGLLWVLYAEATERRSDGATKGETSEGPVPPAE